MSSGRRVRRTALLAEPLEKSHELHAAPLYQLCGTEVAMSEPEIEVHCAFQRMVRVDQLAMHPRNVNHHPANQIKLLANIIAKNGWRSPIVVSKRSGYITKGHGRFLAAQFLKLERAPVDLQHYPDEASELADMLADNRIAELSEWDRPGLKDLLTELDTGQMDMLLTGFDRFAIEDLMTALPPLTPDTETLPAGNSKPTSLKVVVLCDSESERDAICDLLGVDGREETYAGKEILKGQ